MSFSENVDDIVKENRNKLLGMHVSWKRARLIDIASILNGFPFESELFRKDGGTPLIRIRDIVRGRTETYYDGEFDAAYLVQPGEILVGMDGDFNTEPWSGEPALLNQRVCKVTPDESRYSKQFLRYVLPGYLSAINERTPSITVKHLSSRTIADIPLPVPPLPEQHRIVAEIEKQFTRLDAGVAALKRVQANLKRYRASVLKAACEGKLVPTEAELAQAEGQEYESGAALLARILDERRKTWAGRGKYKEPTAPDVAGLPGLPEGWCWATVEQVTAQVADVDHKMPKPADTEIRYVSTRDFTYPDGIDFSKAKTISRVDYNLLSRKIRPEEGDILLSRYGTVGVVRIVRTDRKFQASYSIAIVKTLRASNITEYLAIALRSDFMQKQMLRDVRASAQPDLGLAHIKLFAVPLPPFAEQQRIVAEMERRISVIDELQAVLSANLQRAARLRQAVLQRAFSGEL